MNSFDRLDTGVLLSYAYLPARESEDKAESSNDSTVFLLNDRGGGYKASPEAAREWTER